MALKRWRWVWGPLLAAAAVAAATLPPSLAPEGGVWAALGLAYSSWYNPPGTIHRGAVHAAVGQLLRRVRESQLADSLFAAARGARALRSRDGAVTVIYEPPIEADSARVWLRASSAELELYPQPASGGLPVVVALLSNPHRRFTEGDEYLAGPAYWLSRPATRNRGCVVTVNLVQGRRPRYTLIFHGPSGQPVGRFLDVCALEGRYGAPGPAVDRWFGRNMIWFWQADVLTRRLLEAQRPITKESVGRSVQMPYWYAQMPWVTIGCLDGSGALCARAAGIHGAGESTSPRGYSYAARMLVGYLAAHGTASQLSTFWRSPLPVGDALRAAYRRPAGQLAGEALSHWYTVAPEEASSGPRVVLGGALWAVAALVLAVAVGRRWRTEI
jgi:hypothetical protein